MCTFAVVRYFISSVLVFGLLCSANDIVRLKARVKHLETRLNFQVSFRDEEYAEITKRLDDIDNVLNVSDVTVSKKQPVVSKTIEVNEFEYETVNILRGDFARIRTAFREEKIETERMRREIPKIEHNLVSIADDVDNYCKSALNNTYKILTKLEASSASDKRLMLDLKENVEAVKNSTDENLLTHQDEHLIFKDMAEEINNNSKNYMKMSANFENFKTIVLDMFSKLERLSWYGSSCLHLKRMGKVFSGFYILHQGLGVYCDQTTDGGGWTVFQRRLSGEVDFYRNWAEYKTGFGDLDGEFWLGNDHLSSLTADRDHELRVEMEDFDGNIAYAKYSKFKIYPENDNYKLEVSGYSGTAGDSLIVHNGRMFSTFDRDNDRSSSFNCADRWHGAWWYNKCHLSNLNSRYYDEPGKIDASGIIWYYWKKSNYCLKKVEMKFR